VYDTGLVGLASLISLQTLMIVIPWREARRAVDPRLRASLLGSAGGNAVLGLHVALVLFPLARLRVDLHGHHDGAGERSATGNGAGRLACRGRG
jgi:hypothetical protein